MLVSVAGPAQASSAVQYGKVVFVDDGDTIDVDIAGDGTSRPVRIRYIGIQAMELHVYSHTLSKLRGECWGVAAAKNLHRILCRQAGPAHRAARGQLLEPQRRLQRYVAVKVNGVWTDTGAMQLDAGLVLPDLLPDEYGQNLDYSRRAQTAAANHVGFWGASTYCGIGPSQDDPLEVTVNWDADGNDGENVNGEWVDVVNTGATSCRSPAGGSATRRTAGTRRTATSSRPAPRSAPGERVRLQVGHGTDEDGTYYWGLDEPDLRQRHERREVARRRRLAVRPAGRPAGLVHVPLPRRLLTLALSTRC